MRVTIDLQYSSINIKNHSSVAEPAMNKNCLSVLIITSCISPLIGMKHTTAPAAIASTIGNRPLAVQAATFRAFEANKNTGSGKWLYNGRRFYDFEFNILKFINHLAQNSAEEHLFIADLGCGNASWAIELRKDILKSKVCQNSGKIFHLYSITGGQECNETVEKTGNVIYCQLPQLPIENIDKELLKRGHLLKGKVHLMVSSKTLQHLVDPLGTLIRMHDLLSPQGILLTTGFPIKLSDANEVQNFPRHNANILANNNKTTAIFMISNDPKDMGQLLLRREGNDGPLATTVEYAGGVHNDEGKHKNASNQVTVFNKGPLFRQDDRPDYIENNDDSYYCAKGDTKAKAAYEILANQGFFYPNPNKQPTFID